MINQFHAIYERDGDWFVAFCPEIPEANGMGKTKTKCLENLIDAIRLILQDRHEDSIRAIRKSLIYLPKKSYEILQQINNRG